VEKLLVVDKFKVSYGLQEEPIKKARADKGVCFAALPMARIPLS